MSGRHPVISRALRKLERGDPAGARLILSRCLQRDPHNMDALRALADVLIELDGEKEAARCLEHLALIQGEEGLLDESASSLERAVALWPVFGSALHNLGVVKQLLGRSEEAEACFRRALKSQPTALTWNSLGRLLEGEDRLAEARDCFREAIQLDGDDPQGRANLAAVMHAAGHFEEAEVGYRQALALDGGYHPALTGLAVLLDLKGDYQEGLALLRAHAGARNAPVELVLAYSRLLRHAGRAREAVETIGPLLDRDQLSRQHRQWAHFSLGDLFDDLSDYDQAFGHFVAANELTREVFSPRDCEAFVDRSVMVLNETALAALPRAADRAIRPIFIVGMPRSGTTLVEQILSCHRSVGAGGERNDILAAAARTFDYQLDGRAFPGTLLSADVQCLEEIAERYHSQPETSERTQCMTDKFTANFKFLGLIEMLFPNAAVINCRRDALDCGLSCFTRPLSGAEFAFASRLEHIGFYYRQYERLMDHWRNVLSLSFLDLDYEDLVASQESTTRKLLTFLGLDWDPRCLEFHKHARFVNTASHAQVRRPLYKNAVGRHANYGKHLRPLVASLGAAA